MIRIGLIGAGWHALADHAPALLHCAREPALRGLVELSGVFDIDFAKARDAAKRFEFRRAYESLDGLLAESDAAICVIPPAALAASVQAIIQHRQPALIEKPLGRDLNEARRLASLLEGQSHMVSLNRRFDPAVQIARRWMATQQSPAGEVHGIMTRRDRPEESFVWSTGIHLADLLCFLCGPLRLTKGRREKSRRVGDLAGAGGLRGTIQFSPAAERVEESVDIRGDGWSVRIETGTHQPWRVVCRRGDAIELDAAADPAGASFTGNGTADETCAFLRGVLSHDMPGPNVADAMPGTELAAAIQALDQAPTYDGTNQ